MSDIIYLYLKTHNKTGLKYLGKTNSADPHIYRGSGKRWRKHIAKHGYDVETKILNVCYSNREIKYWGEYFSEKWNIVESSEFANLTPENGSGGYNMQAVESNKKKKGKTLEEIHVNMSEKEVKERREYLKRTLLEAGKDYLFEVGREPWNKGMKNQYNIDKPRSEESRKRSSKAIKNSAAHKKAMEEFSNDPERVKIKAEKNSNASKEHWQDESYINKVMTGRYNSTRQRKSRLFQRKVVLLVKDGYSDKFIAKRFNKTVQAITWIRKKYRV